MGTKKGLHERASKGECRALPHTGTGTCLLTAGPFLCYAGGMGFSRQQLLGTLIRLPFIDVGALEQVAEAADGVRLSIAGFPPQLDRYLGFSLLTRVIVDLEPHRGGSDHKPLCPRNR